MKEIDKASKAYQKKMYGYTVKDNIVDTDCSCQQNIIDIDDAFKTGFKYGEREVMEIVRRWLKDNVNRFCYISAHSGEAKINEFMLSEELEKAIEEEL